MEIGTLTVKNFSDKTTVFSKRYTALSTSSGMLYAEMSGNYMSDLNLQKNVIYEIESSIDGENSTTFIGTYIDYNFHAGSSDYYDINGNYVSGTVVLSNRLQFQIIG